MLALQANVDITEKAIQTAKSAIEKESAVTDTLSALASLQCTHDCLITKVKVLYASLNIQSKFPELDSMSLDFVRTLLLVHNLKINIHK